MMTSLDPNKILLDSKLKQTRPRLLVLDQIIGNDAAVSQPDLEKKLGTEVDRVTLYRTLSTFEEKGILHRIMDEGGTANFAICHSNCSAEHHHDEHLHFNCTNCKKVYCLDIQIPKTILPRGFTVDSVQLMAKGTCESCSRNIK
jgi:Fur family ferric uptake transcriptional regulator